MKILAEERSWNWVEKVFRRIPFPYPLVSLCLAICFILYNYILSIKIVGYLYWRPQEYIIILSISLLLLLEPAGVQYFINNARTIFRNLEIHSDDKIGSNDLYTQVEKKFVESKLYYIIFILIISPFIIIDPIRGNYSLWSLELGVSAATIIYDILNYLIFFIIFSSIAAFFWIMVNVSWVLGKVGSQTYINNINIDIFSNDNIGGLAPLRKLILEITVYNSIGISLSVFSFITPDEIKYDEICFLSILFIFGIFLFLKGWFILNRILKLKRNHELDTICGLYQQQRMRIEKIISNKDDYSGEKLKDIIGTLEFLNAEKGRVSNSFHNAYDIKTLFTFISAQFLPFLSTYLLPFMKSGTTKNEMVNQLIYLANKYNVLNQIMDHLPKLK